MNVTSKFFSANERSKGVGKGKEEEGKGEREIGSETLVENYINCTKLTSPTPELVVVGETSSFKAKHDKKGQLCRRVQGNLTSVTTQEW